MEHFPIRLKVQGSNPDWSGSLLTNETLQAEKAFERVHISTRLRWTVSKGYKRYGELLKALDCGQRLSYPNALPTGITNLVRGGSNAHVHGNVPLVVWTSLSSAQTLDEPSISFGGEQIRLHDHPSSLLLRTVGGALSPIRVRQPGALLEQLSSWRCALSATPTSLDITQTAKSNIRPMAS